MIRKNCLASIAHSLERFYPTSGTRCFSWLNILKVNNTDPHFSNGLSPELCPDYWSLEELISFLFNLTDYQYFSFILLFQSNDSGITKLPDYDPGESSDFIDDLDILKRPPSPCNVDFEGANVIVGKSLIQRRPKKKVIFCLVCLNIHFLLSSLFSLSEQSLRATSAHSTSLEFHFSPVYSLTNFLLSNSTGVYCAFIFLLPKITNPANQVMKNRPASWITLKSVCPTHG